MRKKGLKIALLIVAILAIAIVLYAFVFSSTGDWIISKFKPDTEEQKLSYSSVVIRQVQLLMRGLFYLRIRMIYYH